MVYMHIWVVYASGSCTHLSRVCVWIVYISGSCGTHHTSWSCMHLGRVFIWVMSGSCTCLGCVCVWVMYASGLCTHLVCLYICVICTSWSWAMYACGSCMHLRLVCIKVVYSSGLWSRLSRVHICVVYATGFYNELKIMSSLKNTIYVKAVFWGSLDCTNSCNLCSAMLLVRVRPWQLSY